MVIDQSLKKLDQFGVDLLGGGFGLRLLVQGNAVAAGGFLLWQGLLFECGLDLFQLCYVHGL